MINNEIMKLLFDCFLFWNRPKTSRRASLHLVQHLTIHPHEQPDRRHHHFLVPRSLLLILPLLLGMLLRGRQVLGKEEGEGSATADPAERRTVRSLRCGLGSTRMPGSAPGGSSFSPRRASFVSCSSTSLGTCTTVFGRCAMWWRTAASYRQSFMMVPRSGPAVPAPLRSVNAFARGDRWSSPHSATYKRPP